MGGCAAPAHRAFVPSPSETRVAALMAQRLEVARHVAWVKFQNSRPVTDPKREAELLESLVRQGSSLGVPAGRVERFFTAQILASRREQTDRIAGWTRGEPLPAFAPWDLNRHIRPKLDAISSALLAELREAPAWKPGFAAYARFILRQHGFSWAVAHRAARPFP